MTLPCPQKLAKDFPASGFDGWAETYDRSVSGRQEFPFTGYELALDTVVSWAEAQPGMRVLDLGTGTGNLAARFAGLGCELWCTDFSEPMLAGARRKLPAARCVLHDLRLELPSELAGPFDRIVSAYVFHHFPLEEKVRILRGLTSRYLAPAGRLVIADISFRDQPSLEQVKLAVGEAWEDEYYWLAEASTAALEAAGLRVRYEEVSNCAGVFLMKNEVGS